MIFRETGSTFPDRTTTRVRRRRGRRDVAISGAPFARRYLIRLPLDVGYETLMRSARRETHSATTLLTFFSNDVAKRAPFV